MHTQEPRAPNDGDYDSIENAVMETARGRWFLAEHARRHRLVETEVLRALLERLEAVLRLVRPLDGRPNKRHPAPSPPSHVEHGFNFEPFLAAAPSVTNLAAPSVTKNHAVPAVAELNVSGMTQAFLDHRGRCYVQQIALGRDGASLDSDADCGATTKVPSRV
jgi:hypothetical protein